MKKNQFALDRQSLVLLENFVSINPSLEFLKGKDIRTTSQTHSMFASGRLNVDIPKDFVIVELAKFLNYVSLFDEHIIELFDNYLTISDIDERQRFVCHYGKRDLIIAPEKDELPELPSQDIQFEIKKDQLQKLFKAVNMVGVTDLVISSAKNKISVTGTNTRDSSSDSYSFDVENSSKSKKDLKCSITVDDLKILLDDYTVQICDQGIARFAGNNNLQYFIGVGV